MKKFTVKDFVIYNNPCFNCGRPMNFHLYSSSRSDRPTKPPTFNKKIDTFMVNNNQTIEVVLKRLYSKSLVMYVDIKTNKFSINDEEEFRNYLLDNNLQIKKKCIKCDAVIISQDLIFNLNKGIIEGIVISYEEFTVCDNLKVVDDIQYRVRTFTYKYDSITEFYVYKAPDLFPHFQIQAPPFYLYKFKTKGNLLKKLKTYLLFS